jgi:hypothetical protein
MRIGGSAVIIDADSGLAGDYVSVAGTAVGAMAGESQIVSLAPARGSLSAAPRLPAGVMGRPVRSSSDITAEHHEPLPFVADLAALVLHLYIEGNDSSVWLG